MATRTYYDKDYDSLILSQKEANERVKKNFMFDDVIISLTGSGKIVSIEIRDVSNFLKELGFNPKILDSMTDAIIDIKPKKDFLFIGFQIYCGSPHIEQRVPVANIPVSCMH